MRIHRIMCLGAAIATSQLATAELPFPKALLGQIEGTLDSCAKSNPKDAQILEKRRKKLLEGAQENELSDARATKEYKDAYEKAQVDFSKMPKDKAKTECAVPLEESK